MGPSYIYFPAKAKTPMLFVGLGSRYVRDETLVRGYSGVHPFAGAATVVVVVWCFLWYAHVVVVVPMLLRLLLRLLLLQL